MNEGAISDTKCPCCGSENISASPFDCDVNVAWCVADCGDCEGELPPKFRTALEKAYEEGFFSWEAFYDAALKAAGNRGAIKAEEDIDKILGETK